VEADTNLHREEFDAAEMFDHEEFANAFNLKLHEKRSFELYDIACRAAEYEWIRLQAEHGLL
jgi:hypothetical protein